MDNPKRKRKIFTLDSFVQKIKKKTDDSSTNKDRSISTVNLHHPSASTSKFTEYGGESSGSSLCCSKHKKNETQEEEQTTCTSSTAEIYIDIENVNFTYTFNYDFETNNGEEYITIKDSTLIYEPSRVYFSLENLFNGDERLGREMNKFLNENWLDVSKEIYPALAETINAIVTSVYNGYFYKVPYHDILSP